MKVGSMSRGKRILLVATVLVLAGNGLSAGLFSRKAKNADKTAAASAAMTLTAVDADASTIVLHTSATPAYTSYSPSPDVFVVDLTGAARPAELALPAQLPAVVASISADDVVEMGNRLTRVTFRLHQPVTPQAAAAGNAVVVTLPAVEPIPALVSSEPAASEPPAVAEAAPAPEPAPVLAEPLPVAEPVATIKARSIRRIETAGTGAALEVQIAADGAMTYKTFRLENPSRIVIDIEGVQSRVVNRNVPVDGSLVKAVRIGQFKSAPDPVARVVVDITGKTDYAVTPSGDRLRVTFGPQAATKIVPAPPVQAAAAPPVEKKPAASVAEISPIVEEAVWKMPPQGKEEVRHVINAPADQYPPTPPRPVPMPPAPAPQPSVPMIENVFDEAAQPVTPGGRTIAGGQRVFTGEPIAMTLKDADIKDVLRTFANITGLNIAVDPNVTGSVTVDFVDVPWDQALDLILRQNGLAYVLEGNVMRIGTIERLAAETAAQRRLAEEERLAVPTTTLGFKLSYARASDVAGLLREIASPRARIIVDTRTNQLIISEIPQYLQTMRNMIETVDIPNRQVVIEARIVDVRKTFALQYGFDWGFDGILDPALGTGTGLIFPNRVGFTGGPFSFGLGDPVFGISLTDVLGTFTLDLALSALETETLARVISAPKVTAQDNTPAEIQSGVQIPYQTRVNFTTTINYIDATLRLSVVPQITEAGTIILDIQVQKTTPGRPIEGAAGTPLTTRQARTRLMVRDGGTAVIGGIYESEESMAQSRIPILGQIPILGVLFRSHDRGTAHNELVIFITPRIQRGT